MPCWERNVPTTSLSPVPSFHTREIKITWISGFFIKGSKKKKKSAIHQNDRTVLAYCNFKVKLLFFLLLQWKNAECITIILRPRKYSSITSLWTPFSHKKSHKEKEVILGLAPRTKSLSYCTCWKNSCQLQMTMTSLGALTRWAFCSNHKVTCPTSFQKINASFLQL